MKIRDIMSSDIQLVSTDTPFLEVAKKMRKRDCGCVLVADSEKLVGIITDRDIAIRTAAEIPSPAGITAGEVMSAEILYCFENEDVETIARIMYLNKVRRLVVLDENKHLVGLVAMGDITIPVPEQDKFQKLKLVCHPDLIPVPLTSTEEVAK